MGMLYTTEGTRRVADTLNTAFDAGNGGLGFIRTELNSRPILKAFIERRNWMLVRLAWIFQIYPADQGPTPRPIVLREKARWHWFLKNVLASPANKPGVHDPIRNALADAMLNRDASGNALDIGRVAFDHLEIASGSPYPVIFDAPLPGTTSQVRTIILFTPAVAPGENGSNFDPPGPGEPPQLNPPWRTT